MHVAIIAPTGVLGQRMIRQLYLEIAHALTEHPSAILIDGEQVRYRGPAGLADLVALGTRAEAPMIGLCHLPPALIAALQLAGVYADLRIFPDRAVALAALGMDP